jgi:hypothetical protein
MPESSEFSEEFGKSVAIESYGGSRSATASRRNYLEIEPNITIRDEYTSQDYYKFRPSEDIDGDCKPIMKKCQKAYSNVGLIKQVIDLMGDFASQGVRISHPNKSIERFYKRFWTKVDGDRISERFLNGLYRLGNVVVYVSNGKLTKKDQKDMSKAEKRVIPFQYHFLNPIQVELDADYSEIFAGIRKYKLKISSKLKNALKKDKSQESFLSAPKDAQYIPLDSNRTYVYHYKKDDWEPWAKPMIHAVLDDITMLEKMKLADMSALDGAISNIRLWKIGSLEYKILPKKEAIDKLRDILASNVGGGTMDLVWGPEIEFQESNSQIYKFLGNEKYGPVLSSIYGGLGIPQSLTGSSSASGYTNNFLSLKTLIEKLEYGRDILCKFWKEQFEIVAKAMGFSSPAELEFDHMVLSDEVAAKNLIKDLSDRHIISLETTRERLGESHTVEESRIKKEQSEREKKNTPPKASPFHNANIESDYVKIGLQQGKISVEDVTPYDEQAVPVAPTKPGNSPKPKKDNGRPLFKQDSTPRKKKVVLPKGKAETLLWAIEAQKKISEILNPVMLSQYNKRNLRALTKAEFQELELIKFTALCGLKPESEINELSISIALDLCKKPKDILPFYQRFIDQNGREPNVDELRQIYCLTYIS